MVDYQAAYSTKMVTLTNNLAFCIIERVIENLASTYSNFIILTIWQ